VLCDHPGPDRKFNKKGLIQRLQDEPQYSEFYDKPIERPPPPLWAGPSTPITSTKLAGEVCFVIFGIPIRDLFTPRPPHPGFRLNVCNKLTQCGDAPGAA